MINIKEKLLKLINEKRLFRTIIKKLYPYLKGFLIFVSLKKNKFLIISPEKNEFNEEDVDLSKRIFEFYKKMKLEQKNVNSLYKPSALWQNHIDNDFKYLKECYENNNLNGFSFFLQNFGNWKNYLGIESQHLIKKYNSNIFLKKFLSNEIFHGQKELWKFFNKNSNLKEVNMPRFGNQNGALLDKNFFVIGSFFNHIYADILGKYLANNKRNFVVDIGGGYGKLAYYLLKKQNNCSFIDFDIPEVLILAAYYLSKSFPEKKVFLYGQENFDSNIMSNYDLIFLPGWEIEKLNENSIDLTINKNSLGEMNPETAGNFLKYIYKTSKYFFSLNHEYLRNNFDENTFSLINKEFNVDNKFKELIRYPDLSHLIYENNKIDLESDAFFYIYEKSKKN